MAKGNPEKIAKQKAKTLKLQKGILKAGKIGKRAVKDALITAIPGGIALKAGQAILKSFKKKPKPPKKTQTVQKPSKPKSIKRNTGSSPTKRRKR